MQIRECAVEAVFLCYGSVLGRFMIVIVLKAVVIEYELLKVSLISHRLTIE